MITKDELIETYRKVIECGNIKQAADEMFLSVGAVEGRLRTIQKYYTGGERVYQFVAEIRPTESGLKFLENHTTD